MKPQLGLFVKEPVPGQVKTRLTPPLQPDQAAALYRTALHETVTRVVACDYAPVLFFAGREAYFAAAFPQLPRVPQADGDLGRRMTAALDWLLQRRPGPAGLIGSDSPDLPLAQLDAAFTALQQHDVVTIPAADGGYVMIGCRRPAPQLFVDIAWSSAAVLAQTRQRAAAAGLSYAECGGWEDVDDIASLGRLLRRSPASATAGYVRERLRHIIGAGDDVDFSTGDGR